MVRVFKCHSFKSATVVPLHEEPLAICANGNLVFVATRQCSIHIFKQNEDRSFSEWRSINTICIVEKMTYNKYKDYIITLELKKSWKNIQRYVRIYLNWHLEPPHKSTKPRTKVRIAGRAHSLHSSKDYVPQLEVIDLPLSGPVTAFDVCQFTGNFAIAFGREVKLFHILEKTVANSEKTYKDVEPFLELCWNFDVCAVSLSEEFLVCCSNNQVQGITITYAEADDGSPRSVNRVRSPVAFESSPRSVNRVSSPVAFDRRSRSSQREEITTSQLEVTSSQKSMFHLDDDVFEESMVPENARCSTPSSTDSFEFSTTLSTCTQSSFTPVISCSGAIIDDEYYEEWSFEPGDSIGVSGDDKMKSFSKVLFLNSLHWGSPYPQNDAVPPLLRDFRGGPVKSSSGVTAKTVLNLGDLKEQEDWLSVTLIPSYAAENDRLIQSLVGWSGTNPVRSAFSQYRSSVCCYVSSRRGGYLYRLSPGISLVSIYRYTDVAAKVVAGPHLLHVVTKTGLESYTSRWGAVATAAIEGIEGEKEVRPPSSLDICLCGIEPFLGATDISHGHNIIALLTKVEAQRGQDDLHWNLYVLSDCSVSEFYKDMVNFACRIQQTGPSSYLHLLQEAYFLLSWELKRYVVSDRDLMDLYAESCALLGDFYAWPHQDDWVLCLPYYKKSGLNVSDVVRQAIQHRQHSKEQTSVYVYGKGLMQFLDWALFHSDTALNVKQDMSNTILHIYAQTAPESLPALLLLSKLQGYSPDTALHLLSNLCMLKESRGEQCSTMTRLASIQIHLLLCDLNSAEMELSSLDQEELLDICAGHPSLIYSKDSEFTSLGQLMRRHTPSLLLCLLAVIVGQGDLALNTCLQLLENHCDVGRCRNNQVRELLEILLSDLGRKVCFEEAANLLCEIYIQRLMLGIQPQPPKQKHAAPPKFLLPSGNGHFGSRYAWLDYLPPVNSPSGVSSMCLRVSVARLGVCGQRMASVPPSVYVANVASRGEPREDTCTCAFCIQDLLKLQSLLCSKHTGPDLRCHVLKLTEGCPDMFGWDSVWMLCSYVQETKEVAEFAVRKYPQIVPKLAVTICGNDLEKWQMILHCMEGKLREQAMSSSSVDNSISPESPYYTLVSSYKGVLSELVELVSAEEFLLVLPEEGSLWFLLPFITRSLQRKHLNELKTTIIMKGKSLLTQLNNSA